MISEIKKAVAEKDGTWMSVNASSWIAALLEYYEANEAPSTPDLYLRVRAARKKLEG